MTSNFLGGPLRGGLPPTVSVIISTYNRPGMLDTALESVAAQTYDDFDVWVIDDASTEPLYDIFSKWNSRLEGREIPFYAARLPFQSGYQCVPKNSGIFHSRGDFIAYLDDDNTWEPDHLSVMMQHFTPDVDMVYCGINYINQTDDAKLVTGRREALPWEPERLAKENYIDTSAMIHSRGAAAMLSSQGYNVWDESLRRFADWNLVTRFARLGLRAAPVPNHYINYVWHGKNLQLTRKPAGTLNRNLADVEWANV